MKYTHVYVEVDSNDSDICGKLSSIKQYESYTENDILETYNYLLKLIVAFKEKGKQNYPYNCNFREMYPQFNSDESDYLNDLLYSITPNPSEGWSNITKIQLLTISTNNTVLDFR